MSQGHGILKERGSLKHRKGYILVFVSSPFVRSNMNVAELDLFLVSPTKDQFNNGDGGYRVIPSWSRGVLAVLLVRFFHTFEIDLGAFSRMCRGCVPAAFHGLTGMGP